MSWTTGLGLVAAALLVAANAVFVAVEFALLAVDRIRIERLATEGRRAARTTLSLLKSLSFQLSGAQLGITATSLALGFIARPSIAEALAPAADRIAAGAATGLSIAAALVIAVVVQMVLGELVPKTLAIARPPAHCHAPGRSHEGLRRRCPTVHPPVGRFGQLGRDPVGDRAH